MLISQTLAKNTVKKPKDAQRPSKSKNYDEIRRSVTRFILVSKVEEFKRSLIELLETTRRPKNTKAHVF